jgi:lipoprotein-releasing system ATP-binding protein
MSEPLLRARGLDKAYQSGSRRLEVLKGLDLDVHPGEMVAIVGESGVGKSTLLHVLGGLDRPDSGRIRAAGHDLCHGPTREISDYRNRAVGFVFQFHYLLPEFTALENVEMPFRIGRSREDYSGVARAMLVRLGLGDRLHHRPGMLSGGEQQRVAIARAVVTSPPLVLADEPTGNLDPATGGRVFSLLQDLQRERAFALVLATHNERLARGCDRVLRMEDGALRALGAAEAHEYWNGMA